MIKVNYDAETGKVIAFGKDTLPFIEITEEERRQPLPNRYSYYAIENNKFIIKERVPSQEEINNDNLMIINNELVEINKWLFDNDWKVNKIVVGEWHSDDSRWIEYLAERKQKRARQDELMAQKEAK